MRRTLVFAAFAIVLTLAAAITAAVDAIDPPTPAPVAGTPAQVKRSFALLDRVRVPGAPSSRPRPRSAPAGPGAPDPGRLPRRGPRAARRALGAEPHRRRRCLRRAGGVGHELRGVRRCARPRRTGRGRGRRSGGPAAAPAYACRQRRRKHRARGARRARRPRRRARDPAPAPARRRRPPTPRPRRRDRPRSRPAHPHPAHQPSRPPSPSTSAPTGLPAWDDAPWVS